MTGKTFAAAVLLLPAVASASAIKQRPHGYSFDVASAAESDVFVVCAGSPDDRISVLPAPPRLAMRLSRNELNVDSPKNTAAALVTTPPRECVNCLLGTVHFPFDSAVLTQKERANLDSLIQALPADAAVNVAGYTCDLGSVAHNRSLSLRRAQEVAAYLQRKKVSVLEVEGKGKCCPASDDRHLNRRVEITTQKGEAK